MTDLGTTFDTIVINTTKGRRILYMVRAIPRLNPRTLVGCQARLNGHEVTVIGVETYAVMDPTNMPFGVEVK